MKQLKKTLSILLVIMTVLTICSTAMPVFAAGDLFSNKTFVAESYVQQEMTSKIVGEVSELREEYAKHFVCEDGSYVVATYTEPVHYKENGKWKEIDNSLKLTSEVKSGSGKSMYAPKAGPADVSIPQSFSNDQKISATNKGHTISFGVSQGMNVRLNKSATVISDVEGLTSNMSTSNVAMLQKTMTASTALASKESEITAYNNEVMAVENQSGAIVYEDIFNNADLEYIVTTNSIKENIVVQKKQYDYTYSFDMDFGELVPIVNEDNSIRVVDPETEETVFFVAAPYMYDANCIESTDIDMTLVEDDGIYVLTLKASADWINASERVLPVVIDPTVYMSYNDVYVMSGIVNQNNTKLNNEIRIGKNLTNSTRTYIKPEIPTNIPAGSYINNAQLILQKDYYFQGLGASDIYAYAFDCYKIASWDPSTITWKNQPVDNSKNGYANCDLEFLSSVEATSGRTEYPFDITNAVRRWFAGGRNNGIMLASSNESTTTQVDFYSSRAKDSNTYPQIYITYTAPSVSTTRWETDSRAKESSAFTITTSSNWTISSNAKWISLSTTSGNGIGSSKIIVTENTSVLDRVGTVTVKMGSTVIGTIIVTQYGDDPYLTVSPALLNFDVGSSKQKVNITSNTAWSFGNLPEWITVTPSNGSMNSTVEVEVSLNNNAVARESNIMVTADTVTKTIKVAQLNDTEAPTKPDIYEEDGLVYISSRTFDFDEGTETEEHIEYKIDNGEWTDYENEPISIIRTYDATIYARVCDKAGNTSEVVSLVLESDLGEYTASYTDIALGEGLFPVEFGRTYTSTNGWFFTFDANIAKIDDNAYIFTDFYGEKQYFIKNAENKFVSVGGEELTVNSDSYVLTYGYMTCTFDSDGKINRITTDYLDTQYTWTDNSLIITGGATITFTGGKPTNITITRTDSEDISHTKEVDYVWTDSNLTRFIDATDVEHNYVYTNGLLTTNETETIIYSAEGRVKLILQPNGAFVKYTYNDNAENPEASNNIGAVTVSDSKGVTDTIYYVDGVYISSTLSSYSDNVVYEPESISNALTKDGIADVLYVVEVSQEDEVSDEIEKKNIDENEVSTIYESETINIEYPLYTENVEYNSYGSILLKEEIIYESETDAEPDVYKKEYLYDVWNQCVETISTSNSKVSVEKTEYDNLGRTIKLTQNDKVIDYSYDNKGNLISETTNNEVTRYEYSNSGNVLLKTLPNNTTVSYGYDLFGNMISKTYLGYKYVYNTLGSILDVSVVTSENSYGDSIVSYTYSEDIEQLLVNIVYGNNQIVNNNYNEDGEISSIQLNGAYEFVYDYNKKTVESGNIVEYKELQDNTNECKKIIDDTVVLVKGVDNKFLYSVETDITLDENELRRYYHKEIVSNDVYEVNSDDHLDVFNLNNETLFSKYYQFDEDDNIIASIVDNVISSCFEYNNGLVYIYNNQFNNTDQTYTYTYDDNENLTTQILIEKTSGKLGETIESSETINYVYDDKNQLISAETSSIKYEYTYDDRGNILTKKEYSIRLDDNNQKVYTLIETNSDSYVYDEIWKDKLICYNGQSIMYDEVGNSINYLGHNLTWTFGRQLASFDNIIYCYNEDGIRTSKQNGEVVTKYYLDETNIIEQDDGVNRLHFLYDSRNEITGFFYNENVYHYVKNIQNDITAILNSAGDVVAEYEYDAFGKVLSITGSYVELGNLNPFRYRSYYYDSDIQMYYLQSRYYDPEVCRFISSDDFSYIESQEEGLSWNAFSYCENNPINGNDKDGHGLMEILSMFKKVIPIVKNLNALYSLITIKYDDLSGNRTNSTKGIISIDFTKETDLWYQGFKQGRVFSDEITDMAFEKFENKKALSADDIQNGRKTITERKSFDRCFLFSKYCVSNEIYLHLQGYLWALGKKGASCPVVFTGYWLWIKSKSGYKSKKDMILATCDAADIYEADVHFNKKEAAWYGFDYYNNISECYKWKKYDPYYNTKTGKRSSGYIREGWLKDELSCDC